MLRVSFQEANVPSNINVLMDRVFLGQIPAGKHLTVGTGLTLHLCVVRME